MGDITTALAQYFGLRGTGRRERGAFIFPGQSGPVRVHKTDQSPAELQARYDFLRALEERGFAETDALLPAADGRPFVLLGRDTWAMTRHITGTEANLEKTEDVCGILDTITRLHRAARGLNVKFPHAVPLDEAFEKAILQMNTTLKQLGRMPRLSDFDVLILKHAPEMLELAHKAAGLLRKTAYAELLHEAQTGKFICHNALKEESLPISGGRMFVCNWHEATVDCQLTDIAAFIRRYARRGGRVLGAAKLLNICGIEEYSKERDVLYAMLLFPWPFFRTVQEFYAKKRAFTPAAFSSRMDEVLALQDNYLEYIRVLSPDFTSVTASA